MFISKKELEGLKDFVNKALDGAANAQNRVSKFEDRIKHLEESIGLTPLAEDVWRSVDQVSVQISKLEAKKAKKKAS